MERKIYGIFMAAGRGTRMGGDVPKQFLDLNGIPVLQRTIEKFLEACPGLEVVTVLPPEHMDTWRSLCSRYGLNCKQLLVEGGITRFHSVKNALAKVPRGVTVFIHDGVRPLISSDLIGRMVEQSGQCRALIPVVPVTDSLKALVKGPDGQLSTAPGADPDRSCIYGAQTPQFFRSEDIKDAYETAYDVNFTDDASVARKSGIPLSYIAGEKYNLKLTTPEDISLAQYLLNLP